MPATILLWAFVLAHVTAMLTLGYRGWWRRFPAFMSMMFLDCVSALTGAVDRPHGTLWWYYTWTPLEFTVMAASCAAVIEVLFRRTRCLDAIERFSCRFGALVVAIGCVGLRWNVHAGSWYGWLVYAREFAWIGMALSLGILTLFLLCRPDPSEPSGPRRHCYILLVLVIANALIGPLPRQAATERERQEMRIVAQQIFMTIAIGCCAAWVRFGEGPAQASAQTPQDRISIPDAPPGAAQPREDPAA